MPSHWIVTCNPERWGFFDFLAEGKTVADIDGWSVVQHLNDLTKGDDVALWVTGKQRGIYAIGEIAGPPELGTGDEHWVSPDDGARQRYFVPLTFKADLSDNPIPGADLKADPRFSKSTVITFPRGRNPHRLDDLQWQAVADRIAR